MTYKPEVFVSGKWGANALVFNTEEEALASAKDLFGRWMLCTNWRAVPSDLPANYTLVDNVMKPITKENENDNSKT